MVVQKYGGGCLETPAKARAVAAGLADLHGRGNRVVVVVSAMGMTAIVDGFAIVHFAQ
jgi:aspartate kinase